MTYTIALPIPLYTSDGRRFVMSENLARDVLTHAEFETVRLLVPRATAPEPDGVTVDLNDHPNLSIAQLPIGAGRRDFWLKLPQLWRFLRKEAAASEVWQTCCSIAWIDMTHLSWSAGRAARGGLHVLDLDSDTAAMIRKSGGSARKANHVEARYKRWTADADMTVMVGEGVEQVYGPFTRRIVQTPAVWLQAGDLASEAETRAKFADPAEPLRIALPSRFSPWKGIDDTIEALCKIGDQLPPWQLDIIGEGEGAAGLHALAKGEPRIRFLPPLRYGDPFFAALRTYHLVIAPTRALEQTRIVFDAAASGAVVMHSNTPTLMDAMKDVRTWTFPPGDVDGIGEALLASVADRREWLGAALGGIQAMQGRTIATMHRIRHAVLQELRANRA